MNIFRIAERRVREPEVMDDPTIDRPRHHGALRALARINTLSASTGHVWRPIHRLARRHNLDRIRVLDVATGGGDIPLGLWRRARRANLKVDISGIDISEQALDFAKTKCRDCGDDVRFECRDVLSLGLPDGYDVVVSSLFLHHLDEPEAVRLLSSMGDAAQRLVVVNDLRRSAIGLLLARAASRLLTTSDIVAVDAPLSVRAAFTPGELRMLAEQAGLAAAEIKTCWPYRMLLTWQR